MTERGEWGPIFRQAHHERKAPPRERGGRGCSGGGSDVGGGGGGSGGGEADGSRRDYGALLTNNVSQVDAEVPSKQLLEEPPESLAREYTNFSTNSSISSRENYLGGVTVCDRQQQPPPSVDNRAMLPSPQPQSQLQPQLCGMLGLTLGYEIGAKPCMDTAKGGEEDGDPYLQRQNLRQNDVLDEHGNGIVDLKGAMMDDDQMWPSSRNIQLPASDSSSHGGPSFLSTLIPESLHRAFCFGAIDGALTGSGIVSAAVGLLGTSFLESSRGTWADPNVHLPTGPGDQDNHVLLFGLSLACAVGDGVCMAIGHVWSSWICHEQLQADREREAWYFENYRGMSRARLVDHLMGMGMLKIDATSVADTLEGYPDLFLSTLVGEGVLGLTANGVSSQSVRNGGYRSVTAMHSSGNSWQNMDGGGPEIGDLRNSARYPDDVVIPPHLHKQYHPHHHRGISPEFVEDEEALDFSISESRNEGIVMMLAFCLFASLPSLAYIYVGKNFKSDFNNFGSDINMGAMSSSMPKSPSSVSPTSVVLGAGSIAMLLMGMWKSHFYDASWIIFGMETVIVLLMCVMSSYFVGVTLSSVLGI
mmetsp:Transcript_43/g.97  ORF Transcript_43/g.97 Transcript_43/m.97 type:complete len:587 (-) Transcript_43:350-2110(-)